MSYQALELDGNGWASIADAPEQGLNMGLSDFMVEVRVKFSSFPGFELYYDIVSKTLGNDFDYLIYLRGPTNVLLPAIMQSDDTVVSFYSDEVLKIGKWYYVVMVVDGNFLRLFIDGNEDANSPLAYDGTIKDTGGDFYVGDDSRSAEILGLDGLIDELRIWNFGYGGLPADYEAYIAWRAAGRNVFLDIGQYNGGAWNRYADADRTELLVDTGLENWDDSTLDNWAKLEIGSSTLNKETSDKHGGSAAARFDIVDGDAVLITQGEAYIVGEAYEVTLWAKTDTADKGFYVRTQDEDTGSLTSGNTSTTLTTSWAEYAFTFIAIEGDDKLKVTRLGSGNYSVYFDDISVKRVGLVAHYKFDGTYDDETTNANHLTEGGTGNVFPGYTLKRDKIIAPLWVR